MFRCWFQGVVQFEQSRGLDAMETLEYSNNEVLRQLASEILETYFYKEDDE
jgi:hypothetical protein